MKAESLIDRARRYILQRLAVKVEPVKPEWANMSEQRWKGIVAAIKKEAEPTD